MTYLAYMKNGRHELISLINGEDCILCRPVGFDCNEFVQSLDYFMFETYDESVKDIEVTQVIYAHM